jgi:hypothetical protein
MESEIVLFHALLQMNNKAEQAFVGVCVYGSETINKNQTLSAQSNAAV